MAIAVVLVLAVGGVGLYSAWVGRASEISVTEFWEHVEAGRIGRIEVYGADRLAAFWKEPPAGSRGNVLVSFPGVGTGNFPMFEAQVRDRGGAAGPEIWAPGGKERMTDVLIAIMPWAVLLLVVWFFLFRRMRSAGAETAVRPLMHLAKGEELAAVRAELAAVRREVEELRVRGGDVGGGEGERVET